MTMKHQCVMVEIHRLLDSTIARRMVIS